MSGSVNHIRSGKKQTVVVINGFMSESSEDVSDWMKIVDKKYPDSSVIHLDWGASNIKKVLAKFTMNQFIALLSRAALGALPVVGWFSAAYTLANLSYITSIIEEWANSIENTVVAGELLANYIDNNESEYIIMGHSLGARVSYHTLSNLKKSWRVSKVYLFGGAISREEAWVDVVSRNNKLRLINAYSNNDDVLKYLYRAGTGSTETPIGLAKITPDPNYQISNIDLSSVVEGHMKYKENNVGEVIRKV